MPGSIRDYRFANEKIINPFGPYEFLKFCAENPA
jgi:hypothetical protein